MSALSSNYYDILNKLQATPPNLPSGSSAAQLPGAGGGTTAAPSSAASRLAEYLQSPAGAALLTGGLGIAGGVLNNKANAADAAAQREQQLRMLLSQTAEGERSDNLSRDTSYLASTQMDPVKQQKDLMRAGVMKVLAQNGAPQVQRGGVTNTPDLSGPANQFLSDPALAAAAQRFYTAAGTVSPSAPPANLSSMGFKTDTSGLQDEMNTSIMGARKTRADLNTRQRDDLVGNIQGAQADQQLEAHKAAKDDDWLEKNAPPPEGMHWHDGELSEDGSGFWHKFAKYAGIAGAGVATAMTGGAASPLLAAAIGAGSGAAVGWGSGGGTKGALMGAGLGAIPGASMAGSGAGAGGRSSLGLATQIAAPAVANAIKPGAGQAVQAGLDYFNRRGR